MKNYEQLFQARFNKSTELDDKFIDIWHNEGIDQAINYLKSIGATWLDIEDYMITYKISEFTKSCYNEEEKEDLINSLNKLNDYVTSAKVQYNDVLKLPEAVIETTKGKIRAIQFSKLSKEVKEVIPCIEDDGRFGKCFDWAYYICLNLGIPNDIVTGYVYGYTDKSKFLHSWIETTYKGEEWVIDGTINTIINKEGYYLIKNAQVLNRISNKTFVEDIDLYLSKIKGIQLEVYYVFRDEIIRDLERNKDIFHKK